MKVLNTLFSQGFSLVIVATCGLASLNSRAEDAQIKVNDLSTAEDTTITIKKGPIAPANNSVAAYEIVSGSDDIASDEEYDEKRALAGWKQACADWKREIKDLNHEGQILSMNCGSKEKIKDNSKVIYKSQATYKMRVKVVESSK